MKALLYTLAAAIVVPCLLGIGAVIAVFGIFGLFAAIAGGLIFGTAMLFFGKR